MKVKGCMESLHAVQSSSYGSNSSISLKRLAIEMKVSLCNYFEIYSIFIYLC